MINSSIFLRLDTADYQGAHPGRRFEIFSFQPRQTQPRDRYEVVGLVCVKALELFFKRVAGKPTGYFLFVQVLLIIDFQFEAHSFFFFFPASCPLYQRRRQTKGTTSIEQSRSSIQNGNTGE